MQRVFNKGSDPFRFSDASHFEGEAERIVSPSNEEEISQLLRQANQTKTLVTVLGGGTGLTGASVPQGGILLSTERLNRILKIHWDHKKVEEGYAVVQPAVTLRALEDALEKQGLFYPPDPGERQAFIGGTVATNASGARSFKYGSTRRYVRRLRIVLPNGDLLECTRGREKARGHRFILRVTDGRMMGIQIPTYSMPAVKNAAGYFAKKGMDLIDLFIGSEGTLGVFTEIELKILKRPEPILGGITFFQSEIDCFRFAQEATASGLHPRLLEFFDFYSLRLLAKKHPKIPKGARAALFFEAEHPRAKAKSIRLAWHRAIERFPGSIRHPWMASSPNDRRSFQKFRYDLPVLVNEQVALNGFRKIGTDMAVPETQAEEMFNFYLEELPKTGIDYVIFGHLGDHHLHVNLLPKTQREFDRTKGVYDRLAEKAIAWKGTISAEHGIGKVRIPYLKRMVGEKGLKEMARVKRALDPNGILNRGNIVPVELLKG